MGWWTILLACVGDGGRADSDEPAVSELEANLASGAGDFAADFLTAAPYDRVLVEIDHVEGHAPSEATLDRLREVIEDLCNKPGGVEIRVDDALPPQGAPSWSVSAAQDLEIAWRDEYRDADTGTAVLYGLWLDGSSDRDGDGGRVLGYAVHGSSFVMFAETIADAGSGLPLIAPDVEPTVVAHEVGHLLGLVNNGVPMVAPHQDDAHGNHDVSEDCLMYWAVETDAIVDVLLGGVPDFDDACRDDIAAAGGKGR